MRNNIFRKRLLHKNNYFRLFIGIVLITLVSCGIGRNVSDRLEINDYRELEELVKTGEFGVEHEWALPLRGSMVNLIGNPNYIRFENDSVSVYLPYYGVRHSGGGYGSEGGIKFEGIPENFEVIEGEEDGKIIVEFEADQGSENLDFRLTLFDNGNATTSVTSSQRDAISYRGKLAALPEEDDDQE